MRRYVKRPRSEPTSEEFLALLILLGPLAYVVRCLWRLLRELAPGGAYLAAAWASSPSRTLRRTCQDRDAGEAPQ